MSNRILGTGLSIFLTIAGIIAIVAAMAVFVYPIFQRAAYLLETGQFGR